MKRKVWALLTTLAVCISSTNLSALAAGEGVVLEQQAIDVSTSTEQMEYMIPFCEEKENVTVEFKLVNEWENGYQAEIVLTNIGTEAWNNWQLDFLSVNNITNIWNGNVLQNEDGICSVSASEYNGTVEPNGTVSIGYCAEGMDYSIKDLRISISTVDEEQDDTLQPEAGDLFMYEYEHFAVEYIIQNSWSENCNVCLRISNTSEVDIENWQLVWKSEDAISNVYNAKMTCEDNIYTLKNVEYNQDIFVGDTVEIGFDVYYGDSLDIPKGFAMLDVQQIVVNEGYSVENVVTNTWDSGYTGELWLTNTGSNTMEDWYLTIQSEDAITNIWIGTLTNLGNGMYSIKNPQHQQNLQPGETIIIDHQSEGNQPDSLVPVMLSVYVGEKDEVGESGENDDTSDDDGNNNHEDDANDNDDSGTTEDNMDDNDNDDTTEEDTGNDDREVDFDEDDEEEPLKDNYIEISTVFEEKYMDMVYMVEEEIDTYQGVVNNLSKVKCVEYTINDAFGNVVKNGNIDYDTATGAWIIEGFGLVVGWNDVVFSICLNDDIIIKETYSYLNSVYENMENTDVGLSDTDGDGLEDYFESVYGTDKNNADSDGDGLNDLEEMLFGTDPGVQDAEEDADEDGLTVAEELQYGYRGVYGSL